MTDNLAFNFILGARHSRTLHAILRVHAQAHYEPTDITFKNHVSEVTSHDKTTLATPFCWTIREVFAMPLSQNEPSEEQPEVSTHTTSLTLNLQSKHYSSVSNDILGKTRVHSPRITECGVHNSVCQLITRGCVCNFHPIS